LSVKIFLSTVSDEFRAYRDQLRADLTRHNVEVTVQEDFIDLGTVTLEKLDIYIGSCDAVVHLVGDMTGAAAKPASTQAILTKYRHLKERLPPLREPLERGEDISYTQWEAWLALYHGKALLIAQAHDTAPRGPNFTPTEASRAAQQAHLKRLRAVERYPGCTFVSPDQLAKQIAYTTILDLSPHGRPDQHARPFPPSGQRQAQGRDEAPSLGRANHRKVRRPPCFSWMRRVPNCYRTCGRAVSTPECYESGRWGLVPIPFISSPVLLPPLRQDRSSSMLRAGS
jgi:Domain of unknown function (DUF4062)